MKERFIVTGGAGFIGSNLVRALNQRGHEAVIVVDHITHDSKRCNLDALRFEEYFDKLEFRKLLHSGGLPGVSAVFHLGACTDTTEKDEVYLNDNNFLYSRELCEWSMRKKARFIYASSAATYGDGSEGYSDYDENTVGLKPLNPYGGSKHAFDLWALETGALRSTAGLKYFNVYGPGEGHKGEMSSLVYKAYAKVVRDGEIALFKSQRSDYRDGEQTRDFIYVTDAVQATLYFYDHPTKSGLFNCGTGRARTWNDLAKALFNAVGLPPKIRYIDIPASIRDKYQYHTQASLEKLRGTGYTNPFLSIEEGVAKYVQDYLKKEAVSAAKSISSS